MTMPAPRPGFAALLRSNLPSRPKDYLVYAACAVVLRFFANWSLAHTVAFMAIAIPACITVVSAVHYLKSRFRAAAGAEDDGEADGDA